MNYNFLEGKVYEDLNTGENVTVTEVNEGITILSNGKRIAAERILDNNFYTESVGVNFFNNNSNNSLYSNIASQIKELNTDDIPTTNVSSGVRVISNAYDDDDDQVYESHFSNSEIERKRRDMMQNANNIRTNNGLESFIDEVLPNGEVNRNFVGATIEGTDKQISHTIINQEDPVVKMFKKLKRSTNFSVNVKLTEKVPGKSFLKMWEESYEDSIIDYLVDEFTNKLLQDPTQIKEQIKTAMMNYVYGKPKNKK